MSLAEQSLAEKLCESSDGLVFVHHRLFPQQHWPELRDWLAELSFDLSRLVILLDDSFSLQQDLALYALVLQARLSGVRLGLMVNHGDRLPFALLDTLPLEYLFLSAVATRKLSTLNSEPLKRLLESALQQGIGVYGSGRGIESRQLAQQSGLSGQW
ncbi:hypothetical protein [Dongshaea marina]|uniref:hypothetical protein n=1 Tax=Dongshaea marina TaxID=2047966 RepID=UPI000D3E029F|nr:hypothetical protein [Dongshaea marina]